MKSIARLTLLYALFAALSTAVNLGSQALTIALYHGPRAIELSILIGTSSGLPVRYVLEKRHIFEFTSEGVGHDGRLFVLYSFMGVFTTALFWGIEYGFHRLFGTNAMRYLGGALGLTLGYVIKYQLDKRFVFVPKTSSSGVAPA